MCGLNCCCQTVVGSHCLWIFFDIFQIKFCRQGNTVSRLRPCLRTLQFTVSNIEDRGWPRLDSGLTTDWTPCVEHWDLASVPSIRSTEGIKTAWFTRVLTWLTGVVIITKSNISGLSPTNAMTKHTNTARVMTEQVWQSLPSYLYSYQIQQASNGETRRYSGGKL